MSLQVHLALEYTTDDGRRRRITADGEVIFGIALALSATVKHVGTKYVCRPKGVPRQAPGAACRPRPLMLPPAAAAAAAAVSRGGLCRQRVCACEH